jgi:sugar lactone lactonase YvrE
MLLDRLGQKTITVTDPTGHHLGQLPLPADPGTLTGVFVDGKDVYVEREHGALVRVGTVDGSPTSDAKELQGRPSKDGQLLLSAVMSGARVVLNAFDRKKEALRFTRAVDFPRPTHTIVLLDTDARGTIYLGVGSGEPEMANIACLDPNDGRVIGRIAVPTSHVPEEAFRDFSVGADGTIVYAVRSDDGVEYRTARCP